MAVLSRVVEKVATIRIMGSAVMDMLMVSLGLMHCYVHNALKPFDAGAGLIFMKEAGLTVKNWKGRDFTIFDETIVAAPPELFDELWEVLRLP